MEKLKTELLKQIDQHSKQIKLLLPLIDGHPDNSHSNHAGEGLKKVIKKDLETRITEKLMNYNS